MPIPSARILVVCLPAVALLLGQHDAPVFRAGTKLVEVTVTVRDKKGQAVSGLAASDFTVLDGGKARPVTFFRFDGVPETSVVETRPPPDVFTNRVEASGGAPRNVTALVLDALNTPPQGSMMARAQMVRYLKALAPETRVGIFQMGHELRILHDFTDDAAALRARLDKAVLGMPLEGISDFERSVAEAEQFIDVFAGDLAAQKVIAAMQSVQIAQEMLANAAARRSRMERTLAAMEALGRHLAGIPGRKNVVWIGGGFSMVSVLGAFGVGSHGGFDAYEGRVQRTSQRLAQQGVVLYIVDSKGLEGPPNAAARTRSPLVRRAGRFERQVDAERFSNDPHSAMELMASITGGRYLYDTNDLASGFKQTIADLRGSYTLGFYAPEEPDNKWHKLRVRVKRPGVTVRHRQGYLADAVAPRAIEWSDEMWREALSNPLGSSLISLTAKRETTPAGEFVLTVIADANGLHFRPDGENLKADLRVAVAERTADGSARPPHIAELALSVPASKWQSERDQGVPFRRQWIPAPDVTTIRVVMLDMHTGRYGSLDVPLAKRP